MRFTYMHIQKDMNMQKPPNRHQPNSNSKPPVWEIDTPLEIKGVAPEQMTPGPRTSINKRAGPIGHGVATYYQNQNMVKATAQALEQEYQARTSQIPQSIETELAAIRSPEPLSSSQSITRELAANHQLTQQKTAELHTKNSIANAFFGGDPFNRHINEFMIKATTMERRPGPHGIAMQAWATSYRAAHDARLLSVTIQTLNQRTAHLHQALAAAQAAEHAQRQAEQEAQRLAAELARINEEAEVRAREQARLAALEEARLAAKEQARIAAEAAAQQVARERAHLEALAELQRLEEQRQAEENARKTTLAMAGSTASAGPLFAGTAGTLVVSQATSLAVRSALQSALTATVSAAVGSAGALASGFAALVYPSPLGNSDLYSLSVPLADLSPATDQSLSANAPTSGQVKLNVGIGLKAEGNSIEYFVVATNGAAVPFDVPVQLATYDPIRKVYTTQSPGLPSIGITWTPIVQPGDASTSLPSSESGVVVYEGATVTALEGRIDAFPELDLDSLGGFITVFPADSGIPPIYTMFRDRRNEPGVASGSGEAVSGNWLGAALSQEGSPIPTDIADKLRGKQYSSFSAFRREFWKAVAADPTLSSHLPRPTKLEMEKGLSPKAPQADQVGKRTKYELHHVKPISEDGEVYNIDNIRILGPKQHINAHSSKGGN
ncbi:S-type pyocin domain-containing protein [Pseudomonas sp. SZMC_28357]|uniref:S-type pyocin domain-containing protein n=1 Tax=Pseudomonas sp. SZMC_28357 TaxID=3074380 RepID=UPI0028723A88|nr:S-type pyocin domain-containing protein [Pseudomonas sp. SZMC_28357]MDR9750061.1 S-type pyocin domain-containing protein [Pseudomonas sp. SZMC_28357]